MELRYRWIRPQDVAASPGMFAFGDLLGVLFLAGVFSLAPTWYLLRTRASSERFWNALS